MGKCAVCGDTFVVGVLKDLCGLPSGIIHFRVGFIDQDLFCHSPKCKEAIETAFTAGEGAASDMDRNKAVRDALPDGPIKGCLITAIDALEAGSSDD